ncbi:MAG: mannose-ethanolamine phosphotransferase gpi13 [Alyxoria varia]|nr:MAG: mannose-ethanolamine phosphotransferase gpi13 [Alyxoria varia]
MEDGISDSIPPNARKEVEQENHRVASEDVLSQGQAKQVEAINKQKEVAFKATHGLLIAFIFLIIVVQALGIYLFTTGFLLTRLVLEHKSECATPPISPHGNHNPGSINEGCWHPKSFEKAVVIIIDALRYDFTIPHDVVGKPSSPRHHYHDALPFFYETATSKPNNAFLLPFIADPPTTTLQRLKGLTAGTLPTFIDAGSNFAGTAIDEDNLIAQLVKGGKSIVHLGDDTWHSLFPGHFDANLTRPYDSFNVWDLHTVDNGVTKHLIPLLSPSNSTRWDVAIGHFLGVDHAGHRYGPDHPAMKAKLQQMDEILRQVTELIDDKTLLVVMGDHGMDSKGDHGGESDDEVEAALWMYSKSRFFGRTSKESLRPPQNAKTRPLNQIDLVSTLALLLGIPIPFNNLGKPIEEAFIGPKGDDFQNLAVVNRLTAAQIHRYQQEYALVRKPDQEATSILPKIWNDALQAWEDGLSSWGRVTSDNWREMSAAFYDYEVQNLKVCKDLWARFNLVSISQGIAILASTFVILIAYARGFGGDTTGLNTIFFVRGLAGLISGAAIGALLGFAIPGLSLTTTSMFSSAMLCLAVISFNFWALRERLTSVLPTSLWSSICVLSTTMISVGFAANSFTIWEDEILLFFLGLFGTLMFAVVIRLPSSKDRKAGAYHAILFMILIRVASLARLCREEQMPYCKTTFYASATSSTSAPWQLIISYIIALALPEIIKTYYNATQSYHGSAPFWIGIAFRACLFLIAAFWTLEVADDGQWFDVGPDLLKTIRMYLAQSIFAITFGAGSATFIWMSPCISVDTVAVPAADQSAAAQLKRSSSPRGNSSSRQSKANGSLAGSKPTLPTTTTAAPATNIASTKPQLVVCGTSNLYGAHYTILPLTILLIPLLLVQKPMGQAALSCVAIAILSLLELLPVLQRASLFTSVNPNGKNTDTERKSTDPSHTGTTLYPVLLALLAHFTFFKTGHQAALSSIQWDAAFIPLRTIRYPWTPLLVAANTFAGPILCAAAVPCGVLWRRGFGFSSGSGSSGARKAGVEEESSDGRMVLSAPKEEEKKQTTELEREDETSPEDRRAASRLLLLTHLARALATHLLVYSLFNLSTTVFAAHLRRHLMLFRVFSPRWMTGVAGMGLVWFTGVAGVGMWYWGVGRSVVAGADVFGW